MPFTYVGDEALKLQLQKESWRWFFDTMFNNKNTVERNDGRSLGNFWAIVQHLQEQFNNHYGKCDKCGNPLTPLQTVHDGESWCDDCIIKRLLELEKEKKESDNLHDRKQVQ